MEVPNVTWNWMPFEKESLFRRGIGRNQAALNTNAHWVWFTDCDLMFRKGCLDALAEQLQGRRDALVYPSEERCTELLREDNPMLQQGAGSQHWWTLMILSSRPVTRPGQPAPSDCPRGCLPGCGLLPFAAPVPDSGRSMAQGS